MSRNKKSGFWNNGWTITIGSGIIILAIPSVVDYFHRVPLLTTAKSIINSMGDLFSYKISLWILFVTIIILAFVAYLIVAFNKTIKDNVVIATDYLNYKEDVFKKWKWSWKYGLDNWKHMVIFDLLPVCTKCDIIMQAELNSYSCPNCSHTKSLSVNPEEHPSKIEALIRNKIEKKLYRQ